MRFQTFAIFSCVSYVLSQETDPQQWLGITSPEISLDRAQVLDLVGSFISVSTEDTPSEPAENPSEILEDMTTMDEMNIVCTDENFPKDDFNEQDDDSRVYMKPARFREGTVMKNAGMDRYTTVFGLHVIVDDGVDDRELLHVTSAYANLLDTNHDGKPDNQKLREYLKNGNSGLFILKDVEAIRKLMMDRDEKSFPRELQHCPFFFDFEEKARIIPGGASGDATCADPADNKVDRTTAFILDHLFGRGFDAIMDKPQQKELTKMMNESVEAGTFDISNTGCPPDNEYCSLVMYVSWAITSYNGFDKCWCNKAATWKLCDKTDIQNGEPDLVELIKDIIPEPEKISLQPYDSTSVSK